VILKIIAVYTSVASFGIISQMMGLIALIGMLAAGGIGSGLTQQLSVSRDHQHQSFVFKASFAIFAITTVSIALALSIVAWPLANWLLDDGDYVFALLLLAIAQSLIGFGTLAQSIAAANNQQQWILQVAAVAALLGAAVVYAAVQLWGAKGVAFALVLNAAMPGMVAIARELKVLRYWARTLKTVPVQKVKIKALLHFAGVTLIGAISITLSQLATRHWIGEKLDWTAVGLWQAVTRLSDLSMQIVAVLLAGYILPRLAPLESRETRDIALFRFTSILLGGMLLTGATMFILREHLISAFFSREFLPSTSLLPWQLLGDQMRTVAVCVSIGFLAQGTPRVPMLYEFAQGVLFLFFTVSLTSMFGIKAPVISYLLTYSLLALVMTILWLRRKHSTAAL
jgi:PST family polysaccharide transporter